MTKTHPFDVTDPIDPSYFPVPALLATRVFAPLVSAEPDNFFSRHLLDGLARLDWLLPEADSLHERISRLLTRRLPDRAGTPLSLYA